MARCAQHGWLWGCKTAVFSANQDLDDHLRVQLPCCRELIHKGRMHACSGIPEACSDARKECLRQIEESRVIACLRARSAGLALEAARAALDGGLSVLEVTMTTPEATKVIASLVQEFPSALIGAGTVLSMQQAQMAKDAGARFLLSPVTVKELVESHATGPVLFVPGAMTPTEVFTAFSYGAKIVKIYPIALAGGLKYLQSLKRLLNHIPVIASQGITTEMVEPYITCGASAVVLSDAIFDSVSMASSDFLRIRKQALAAALKACNNQVAVEQS